MSSLPSVALAQFGAVTNALAVAAVFEIARNHVAVTTNEAMIRRRLLILHGDDEKGR